MCSSFQNYILSKATFFIWLTVILTFALYFSYSILPKDFLSYFINKKENNFTIFSTDFNVNATDVIIFLHIQKTGGTLIERSLVKDGLTTFNCSCIKLQKKCNCKNSIGLNWLFSRYSTGWKCGLHADWTELNACVGSFLRREAERAGFTNLKRRKFFITLLRDPVQRYLSEWRHVQRGATWWRSRHLCQGRVPTLEELPPCYREQDWVDVSFEDFVACRSNLASNRQTRMLADLKTVNCYDPHFPDRDSVMLKSALHTLEHELTFVGLLERLPLSQYVWQRTFGLVLHQQLLPHRQTHSQLTIQSQPHVVNIAAANNKLDSALYSAADKLLLARAAAFLVQDRARILTCCPAVGGQLDWARLAAPDTSYLTQHSGLLDRVVTALLQIDGSNLPSPQKTAQRLQKWRRKLENDLD